MSRPSPSWSITASVESSGFGQGFLPGYGFDATLRSLAE
jgi:hypothetical protein